MSEPTKSWSAGEQLNAADLNKAIREALDDYRDFTYGASIVINEALYLKASDSKAYKTDADFLDERIENFVGFAKEDGNNNDVKKVQVGGIVSGFVGLTPGAIYYLGNTAGAITSAPGTYSLPIGLAVSSTRLWLLPKSLLVSAQTIHGIKTFGSIPLLPASNPTTDNQATRKKYVDDFKKVYVVSDNLKLSSDGEQTTGSSAYVKIKSLRIRRGGNIRIKWEMHTAGSGGAEFVYAKIYFNENPGHEAEWQVANNPNYQSFSIDLEVPDGASVQLWGKISNTTGYYRNFRIYYDTSIIED